MLHDGTGGDGAPPRTPVDGTAAQARERSRELRLQVDAARARLHQLREAGAERRGRSRADVGDLVKQVYEQLVSAQDRIGHLETALASNRRIGMAIGIVMVRHGLTDQAAFALLREQSQLRNQKLRDLAEEVIYTGTL